MRAALYIRVSTEDQAREGYSLAAQEEMLRAYCDAQDWEVADIYADDGYSGRSTNRPEYRRMIEERDRWDCVLVLKMDRIHRNSKNFMAMMEDLGSWDKTFSSSTESLDTSNALGRFVMDMIQRIGQLESEQIGERTYMGMREKAESARGILGFRVPYGYRLDNGILIPDEEEAPNVQWMFSSYLEGSSLSSLAYALNNHKDLSTRKGNPWTVHNVRSILHNPVYVGHLRWEGMIIPSDHRQLVSQEVFNQVQEMMASRARNPAQRRFLRLPDELSSSIDMEGLMRAYEGKRRPSKDLKVKAEYKE